MSYSKRPLVFFVNGKKVEELDPDPEINLLFYLRKIRLPGTKLACGEGGCGACTVMISKYLPQEKTVRHLSVNACLMPLCSVHGMAVTTVEGIGSIRHGLHPVQGRLGDGRIYSSLKQKILSFLEESCYILRLSSYQLVSRNMNSVLSRYWTIIMQRSIHCMLNI